MNLKLEDIKKQCNVDFTDDDALLTRYGEAAESFIEKRLNRKIEEVIAENDNVLPSDLYIAGLMLAAHWSRVREAVSSTAQSRVPFSVESLITPYKIII
jgi:uncharacterized phage protein (predicted DNA packaging)